MIIMLVDIRHKPTDNDKIMYEWILSRGIPYIIIASKADKISRGQLQKHIKIIRDELEILPAVKIITYSSETRQGKEDILDSIESILK